MIAYIIIGFLMVGVLFLTGFLLMARWENRQLREDQPRIGDLVPFRDSRFAEPYVPPNQPERPEVPEPLKPHTAWPATDHRDDREPGSEQDPDS